MKTTILTMALALATVPFTFAAQTPATTPATSAPAATSKPAVSGKTKKHVKPVKKNTTVQKPASTTPAPASK